MNIGRISTGYTPRYHQAIIHKGLKRFSVLVCHRRFGKTVCVLNEMHDRAIRNPLKNPQYAYIAPTYQQAKRVAWDYMKDIVAGYPSELVKINEAELRIEIKRPWKGDFVRFVLLGSENENAIRGMYIDFACLDEFGDCSPTLWGQVVRPALSDRMGGGVFIGTPKGKNHFYDMAQMAKYSETWYYGCFKASETGIIPQSELDAAREEMSEEEYNQEFECSFESAMVGSYYGKYFEDIDRQGRITNVPHDPFLPTEVSFDLGIGDSMAVWFVQRSMDEVRVIDYFETNGRGLDFVCKAINDKKYNIKECYLPHDGKVRELATGEARYSVIDKLLNLRSQIMPKLSVDEGIHAVRQLLPKCYFDSRKCRSGIEALRNYQRKYDAKEKVFTLKPKHDWSSHGADSFRTLALGVRSQYRKTKNRRPLESVGMDWDIYGE